MALARSLIAARLFIRRAPSLYPAQLLRPLHTHFMVSQVPVFSRPLPRTPSSPRSCLSPSPSSPSPSTTLFRRSFGGGAHDGPPSSYIEKAEVESRVLEVVRHFPKVEASKVSSSALFGKDLGLDSLDEVELVMALEDEFAIEIPDQEAEKIKSVADAIAYVAERPFAQ